MPFVFNGVTFDGKHSYADFGMYLSKRPDLGQPVPKLSLVDVPGMDGQLDMTEANFGEVKFTNRTLVFSFSKMVNVADQEGFKSLVRNALHGHVIKQIILDEDPEWYYSGRAVVSFPANEILPWKLHIVVTVDAAPYAMRVDETVIDFLADLPAAQVVDIDLGGNDVDRIGINTDLRFGTVTYPEGLPLIPYTNHTMIVRWQLTANHARARMLQIYDSDGNLFSLNLSNVPFEDCEVSVDLNDVDRAGVALYDVYRVLVSGIDDCKLFCQQMARSKTYSIGRKTIVPVFSAASSLGYVDVTFNGRSYPILDGEASIADGLYLSGDVNVYMPDNAQNTITKFLMTYREGKL